jgi:hypothetical protein
MKMTLTPREQFRLTGTLSAETTERVIEAGEDLGKLLDGLYELKELSGDDLQHTLESLTDIFDRLISGD